VRIRLAVVAVVVALAAFFVRVHGWNDITIGTNTAYCGIHFQAGQDPLHCQSGH
jgi:hypothetical protein